MKCGEEMEFCVELLLGVGRYFNSGSMIRLFVYLGASLAASSVEGGGEDDMGDIDGWENVVDRQLFVAMIAVVTAYVLQI